MIPTNELRCFILHVEISGEINENLDISSYDFRLWINGHNPGVAS